MTVETGAANLAAARAFVASLAAGGLRHAVVCPGSRSTPLALALAERPEIHVWMHVDERSAGFFALGMARALATPVAALCSSGTAAANFAPAVVEADLSRVPLLVLTADRPPELRDIGAAQTIDQIRLFGCAVRLFLDMPVPTGDEALLRHARLAAARALAATRQTPAGPVHVNFPFREPLLPPRLDPFDEWTTTDSSPSVAILDESLASVDLYDIPATIAETERGIIVCGPSDDPAFPAAVAALAEATGYPILADPLSQVRCGRHDRRFVIDRYDAFLRDDDIAASRAPDLVLRFGAIPTSKALNRFLDRSPCSRHILVADGGVWRDPIVRATDVIAGSARSTAEHLTSAVGGLGRTPGADRPCWLSGWRTVNDAASDAIDLELARQESWFEGAVFAALAQILPDGATLFAGNSMPVRDLDSFFPAIDRDVRLFANRGANGIDGVASTALGMAAVQSGPVVLVVGDLSFYHDMNGLLAAKLHALDATIVVLDNDGGGIFSFLPQASVVPHDRFEQLFGTPTGLDPARVAALYDAEFIRPESPDALAEDLAAAVLRPGLKIVAIRTERAENVRQHRAIWDGVATRLRAERFDDAKA
jgi:2-succinyl-5-enolpyruvyl-6-hydroxy-3-cyclohexene-1-carboxylate synthase